MKNGESEVMGGDDIIQDKAEDKHQKYKHRFKNIPNLLILHKAKVLFICVFIIIFSTIAVGCSKTVDSEINKFNLDERETNILKDVMKLDKYSSNVYKYIMADYKPKKPYNTPDIKIEDGSKNDNNINVLEYLALQSKHSFLYGVENYDNQDGDYKSVRIADYLGKGTVEGKEVYARIDNIGYSSPKNDGSKDISIDGIYVSLYQTDNTQVKKVGEISKSSWDGKESVKWIINDSYTYPLILERGKEYYSESTDIEPYKDHEYILATGFKDITINGKRFDDCLEIKHISTINHLINYTTNYYSSGQGEILGYSRSIFIDDDKKEISYNLVGPAYYIQDGKAEWSKVPLKITSFEPAGSQSISTGDNHNAQLNNSAQSLDSTDTHMLDINSNSYTNKTYNFKLHFPDSLKNRVVVDEGKGKDADDAYTITFYLKDGSNKYLLFYIHIYDRILSQAELDMVDLITSKNKLTFVSQSANQPPAQLADGNHEQQLKEVMDMVNKDVPQIIKTFKFVETVTNTSKP